MRDSTSAGNRISLDPPLPRPLFTLVNFRTRGIYFHVMRSSGLICNSSDIYLQLWFDLSCSMNFLLQIREAWNTFLKHTFRDCYIYDIFSRKIKRKSKINFFLFFFSKNIEFYKYRVIKLFIFVNNGISKDEEFFE